MRFVSFVGLALTVSCRKEPPPPLPANVADAAVTVDVASGASPGWDGGSPVATTGEVDGAALRVRNRARIGGDRSAVTVLTGGSALSLGQRLCEACLPARPKNTPILIKPNLGGFEWFKTGADDGLRGRITDAEFVRGIIKCLKSRGHTKITIAEGWGAKHADWEHLVKASGYAAMTKEEGVRLVAMDDDGVFDVQGDQPGKPLALRGMEKTYTPNLLVAKVMAEHLEKGLFISAPKIKAHRFGVVSMSIKGGQGVVMLSDASPAFNQKWRMHKELSGALTLLQTDREAGQTAYLDALRVFAERMTDVLEVEAPDVVLAEGAPAEGGNGFDKRWPSAEMIAIGGTNPILVDRVGAQMLGLWDNADLAKELGGHRTSPLIETAAKRFGVDLAAPLVEGDGAKLLKKPRPVHFLSMSGFSLLSDEVPFELAPATSAVAVAASPILHAKNLDGLVIDGAIESAWEEVVPVTFDTDWSGAHTGIVTHVHAAWKKSALYMLWKIDNAVVNADASRPIAVEREKLYEEDCVELFLGQTRGERAYKEVEIGPLGHFLDLAVKGKKGDVGWSSRPTIATKVDREHQAVTIEAMFEAPEITALLAKGASLPLALYRMEGKSPRRYLAWSPTNTPKPDFHVPSAFGTLVLE